MSSVRVDREISELKPFSSRDLSRDRLLTDLLDDVTHGWRYQSTWRLQGALLPKALVLLFRWLVRYVGSGAYLSFDAAALTGI